MAIENLPGHLESTYETNPIPRKTKNAHITADTMLQQYVVLVCLLGIKRIEAYTQTFNKF